MDIGEVACQGLQRHPFHGKDIVKSLVEGTANKLSIYSVLKQVISKAAVLGFSYLYLI